MRGVWRKIRATWGRPKRHGITGNFSTVVILTGIIIGSYFFTGGGYPEVYPKYTQTPVVAEPIPDQPKNPGVPVMTMRELHMRYISPLPTPIVPNTYCQNQAIAFLVDVSGSMLEKDAAGVSKIDKLQAAMQDFATGLSDTTAIAIYSFSEPFDGIPGTGAGETGPEPNLPEPRERLPMSSLGGTNPIRPELPGIIANLDPYPFAATYMRDGFREARNWLQIERNEFPTLHQNLIFISDGVPETDVRGPNDQCLNATCDRSYSPDQDPTIPTNLGTLIKNDGVDIYSVMIYTQTESNNPQLFSIFTGIMQNVATQATAPYYSQALNADTLPAIFNTIKARACGAP